ncbi:MAG: hypothetical protein NXI22_04210 [bacterium]|nr:hypothetical protein [bacterium]
MTSTANVREGYAPSQQVDGPAFLELMLSTRSMYRCDSPEHHGVIDLESGVKYTIKRNVYMTYLRTRNGSDS